MTINITQEDRDAAARWAKMQSRHQQAANMRRGACDTAPLVQAFARHREAAEAKERERIVAWMRREAWRHAATFADAIERGEHMEASNATSE